MFPESARNYSDGENAREFIETFTHEFKNTWGVRLSDYLKGRVIDVGCGCGYMPKHLQDDGIDCYGLDGDSERVEFARRMVKHPEKIIQADARKMPFENGYFDMAVSTMIYDHQNQEKDLIFVRDLGLPGFFIGPPTYQSQNRNAGSIYDNMAAIKDEVFRVLQPGGIYIVRDVISHQPIQRFFSGFELEKSMRKGGNHTFIVLRKPTNSGE